ncbi:MAG TPA: hypothetical protein VGS27_21670 [Candidatus Sulfotelmatobacter sp.]|nr:hypothetical protein [Candidatus Sulfotelmatobacter sp.]
MSSTNKFDQEMKNLLQDTADDVLSDYYGKCSDFLARLGLHSELDDKESIPLEIWVGIAKALADASGFRVSLQVQVNEPLKDDPRWFKNAGLREIEAAPPHHFVKAIESSAVWTPGMKNPQLTKVYVD